jgi:hypothetical protein
LGRDLLEIVNDRYNRGSTIATSQLPVEHWHDVIARRNPVRDQSESLSAFNRNVLHRDLLLALPSMAI